MCAVQVGGSGLHGAEDGDRAGQDEVHKTALQVFILTSPTLHFTSQLLTFRLF